jgi:hypothetical protein
VPSASQSESAAQPIGSPRSTETGGSDTKTSPANRRSESKVKSKRSSTKKPAAKKRVAKKAAATSGKAKSTLTQKKAPRRGIRLKVDDGQGSGFD